MLIYFIIGIMYTILTSKFLLKAMDNDNDFNRMSKKDKACTVIGMIALWPVRLVITIYYIIKG